MLNIHSRLSYLFFAGLFLIAIAVGTTSCKKEQLLSTGGEIRFSTDTLTFDTVFTAMGSATVGIKIYNPQSQKITLSSVRMGRGAGSPFRLNVDGRPGAGSGVEIAANDSAYVFATVKVDPTDENSPFIVEDRLIATLNGNDFSIPVMAYGQNAHYIQNADPIAVDHFETDKPYVIVGYAIVAPGKTLTIPEGARIYMHQNARIFVLGTLKALGTKKDSIIFQGDRLDRAYYGYEGYPGEWGGIYFHSYSTGNELRHVILRNCGRPSDGAQAAAIQVAPDSTGSITPGNQLKMDRCTIENSIGYGLLAFGGTVAMTNCLVHSCGASALGLVQGGYYQLDNCTFTTYGNTKISHTENPVAILTNYFYISQTRYIPGHLDAKFRNCVIAGSLDDEFAADTRPEATAKIDLQSCMIKVNPDTIRNRASYITHTNLGYIRPGNVNDPMFVDINKWDYRLKQGSPLIDAGLSGVTAIDLDDKPRTNTPDIGAYESF